MVFAAVLATGWAVLQLRVVMIPVFVALLLSAVASPLVNLLARRLPRLLAVWIVFVTALIGTAGLVMLLQGPVRSSVSELASSWETARSDIENWLRTGPLGLDQSQIDALSERAADLRDRVAAGVASSSGTAARLAVEVVGGFFLALVLTFFFLKDGAAIWRWTLGRIHPSRRAAADRGARAAFSALQGWIRGVAITGVVDAVLIGTALVILGTPAAVPLAMITFFGAFFPIVGATIAGALATVIALTTQGPKEAVIVALVVLAVQQVEGDVLLPVVMYRQVALHPVVVLLALAVGSAIGGIIGAVVAVPMTAAATAAVAAARRPEANAGSA